LDERRLNIYKCNSCFHTFTIFPIESAKCNYDDDYYDKVHKNWFDNTNYRFFKFIYEEIIRLLGDKQIQLLEVGCGRGDFLKYIAANNSTAKLFGIDLKYNKHPRIHFIKGDFLEKEIEMRFNIVCSLAVIEHIENPHLFTKKLNKLLQPDGFLFIMTVNNNSLIYKIARFLNRIGVHTAYDRLYSFHHLQHYTNQSLKKCMEMNGFDILLQKNHNYSLKAVDVPEGNFLIKKMYKLLVWIIFIVSEPFGCGGLQTVLCRKRSVSL